MKTCVMSGVSEWRWWVIVMDGVCCGGAEVAEKPKEECARMAPKDGDGEVVQDQTYETSFWQKASTVEKEEV